jgi:hypothetical protein
MGGHRDEVHALVARQRGDGRRGATPLLDPGVGDIEQASELGGLVLERAARRGQLGTRVQREGDGVGRLVADWSYPAAADRS